MFVFFFFNDTATTEIYTLSLHDALPIAIGAARGGDTAVARRELLVLAQIESTLTATGGAQAYWAGQVAIQRLAAGAWLDAGPGGTGRGVPPPRAAAHTAGRDPKHPPRP